MSVPAHIRAQAEIELRRRRITRAAQVTDPAVYCEQNLHIRTKDMQIARLIPNAIQRRYLAERTGRDLILKSRQVGISTIVQADLFRRAVTGTAVTVTFAHDDATTQKMRRMNELFWTEYPDPKPVRSLSNATVAAYPAFHSEQTVATAGSVHAGRGATVSDFHGTEVAFWRDARSIVAGAMQGGNPRVALESTPNGAQGYFYELCREALDGNADWKLHFYPWWEEPRYRMPTDGLTMTEDEAALALAHQLDDEQIAWRRAKQRELKGLFVQEYPEDPISCFLQSGVGYFGDISAALIAPLDPAYCEDHRYVAGLDFGQSVDATALCVIDATAMCEVARLRLVKLPWADMRRRIAHMLQTWNVRTLHAETNSMGTANIEALRDELSAARAITQIVPFTTTNDSKASIAAAFHEALASGLKLQPDPQWTQELQAFSAEQLPSGKWRLSAPDGEHDDTVIARMLAYQSVAFSGRGIYF